MLISLNYFSVRLLELQSAGPELLRPFAVDKEKPNLLQAPKQNWAALGCQLPNL